MCSAHIVLGFDQQSHLCTSHRSYERNSENERFHTPVRLLGTLFRPKFATPLVPIAFMRKDWKCTFSFWLFLNVNFAFYDVVILYALFLTAKLLGPMQILMWSSVVGRREDRRFLHACLSAIPHHRHGRDAFITTIQTPSIGPMHTLFLSAR